MCTSFYFVPVAAAQTTTPWWSKEDLFRSCPTVATCGCGYAGMWLKMSTLKHGRWSVDGGSGVISRLCRQDGSDLGLERHKGDLGSTCHNDMFLVVRDRPGVWLKSLNGDCASPVLATMEAFFFFCRRSTFKKTLSAKRVVRLSLEEVLLRRA
jgi:hypothetical protein